MLPKWVRDLRISRNKIVKHENSADFDMYQINHIFSYQKENGMFVETELFCPLFYFLPKG